MSRPTEEVVWLGFAREAIGGFTSLDLVRTDDRPWKSIDDSIARDAATIADRMVIEWRARYPEADTFAGTTGAGDAPRKNQ